LKESIFQQYSISYIDAWHNCFCSLIFRIVILNNIVFKKISILATNCQPADHDGFERGNERRLQPDTPM
jgi:hypothetical protein